MNESLAGAAAMLFSNPLENTDKALAAGKVVEPACCSSCFMTRSLLPRLLAATALVAFLPSGTGGETVRCFFMLRVAWGGLGGDWM